VKEGSEVEPGMDMEDYVVLRFHAREAQPMMLRSTLILEAATRWGGICATSISVKTSYGVLEVCVRWVAFEAEESEEAVEWGTPLEEGAADPWPMPDPASLNVWE
jgi:hypothetical protein